MEFSVFIASEKVRVMMGRVSETRAAWHPAYQPYISVAIWDHFRHEYIVCCSGKDKQVWRKK